MPAQDLFVGIALDALRPDIPCSDATLRIEEIDGVVANAFDDGAHLLVAAPGCLLRRALLGNVANEAEGHTLAVALNRLEHDVDRKFCAVTAKGEEAERGAHLASPGMRLIVFSVCRVVRPKALRN